MATLSQQLVLTMTCVIIVLQSGFFSLGGCSIIQLEADPASITPLLTPSLSLFCSLNDTDDSDISWTLVGRDLQDIGDLDDDVTSTKENVKFITSIVIETSQGHQLASVTQFSGPQLLDTSGDFSGAKVTGDVTGGAGGVKGYLQVNITYPTDDQAESYVCEVNTVNSKGHAVAFTARASVAVKEPSLTELVQHIHTLEVDGRLKDAKISAQQAQLASQQLLINNLTAKEAADFSGLVHNVTALEGKDSSQDAQISEIISKAKHVETGYIVCDPGTGYNGPVQTFANAYESAPVVFISVRFSIGGHSYGVSVSEVTTKSFKLNCKSYSGANNIVRLHVDWISFSQ